MVVEEMLVGSTWALMVECFVGIGIGGCCGLGVGLMPLPPSCRCSACGCSLPWPFKLVKLLRTVTVHDLVALLGFLVGGNVWMGQIVLVLM